MKTYVFLGWKVTFLGNVMQYWTIIYPVMVAQIVTLNILKFNQLVGYISIFFWCLITIKPSANLSNFRFIKTDNQSKKFASIINPNCSKSEEKNVSTVDLKVLVNNVSNSFITDTSKLIVEIGPNNINYIDYVKNGMKIEKGEKADVEEIVEARMIKLYPQNLTDRSWFSIDSEEYEVKPIKITLLPKLVNIFCIDPNK